MIVKKILSYIFGILSILLLVGLIALVIFQTITLKDNKPTKLFNKYYSQVITASMEPSIKTGSYITYKEMESYKEGDIIVFIASDKLVAHRIEEVINDKFITRGDANQTNDFIEFGYIGKDQVVGKVVKSSTLFGMGPLFLNNRNMVIVIALLIIFLLIIFQIVDVVRLVLKKQKEDFKNKLKE